MKNYFFIAIKRAFYAVLSFVLILTCSCKGTSGNGGESPAPADTLEKVIPLEELFLPDTSYASAGKVVFVVETGMRLIFRLLPSGGTCSATLLSEAVWNIGRILLK